MANVDKYKKKRSSKRAIISITKMCFYSILSVFVIILILTLVKTICEVKDCNSTMITITSQTSTTKASDTSTTKASDTSTTKASDTSTTKAGETSTTTTNETTTTASDTTTVKGNTTSPKSTSNIGNFFYLWLKIFLEFITDENKISSIAQITLAIASLSVATVSLKTAEFSQSFSMISNLSDMKVTDVNIYNLSELFKQIEDNDSKNSNLNEGNEELSQENTDEFDSKTYDYYSNFISNYNKIVSIDNDDYLLELKTPQMKSLFLELEIIKLEIFDNSSLNEYSGFRIKTIGNDKTLKHKNNPKALEIDPATYSVEHNVKNKFDSYLIVINANNNNETKNFFENIVKHSGAKKYLEIHIEVKLIFYDKSNQVPMSNAKLLINVENCECKFRVLGNDLIYN